MFTIINILLIIVGILSIFFVWRNSWITNSLDARIDLYLKDPEYVPEHYWSYSKMVFCFWIWDIEKMKDEQ